jgi:hypothetical protein
MHAKFHLMQTTDLCAKGKHISSTNNHVHQTNNGCEYSYTEERRAQHTGAAAIAALGATAGIAGFRGHRTAR